MAEDTDEPRIYRILAETCKELNHQEEHWTNYEGDPRRAGGLRATVRQVQIVTALKTCLDLRPDDPQVHEQLANLYLQMNFLDSGLEQMQAVAREFERFRPKSADPKVIEGFNKRKEGLEKDVQNLATEVKKRHEQYALEASSKKSLEKFALAMNRGLAKEAVEELATMKSEGLSKAEKAEAEQRLIQVLLLMGRAGELRETMINPGLTRYRVLHAAALGNYGTLDQVLGEMIQGVADNRTHTLPDAVAAHVLAFANPGLASADPASLYAAVLGYQARLRSTIQVLSQPEAELLTLRGLMALEWGATAAARSHFEAALRVAGPTTNFQDRVIAERYGQLMR